MNDLFFCVLEKKERKGGFGQVVIGHVRSGWLFVARSEMTIVYNYIIQRG